MSVAAILQALAENAGRQQMYRGAVIGNTISEASQIPAQMIADRRRQAVVDLEQQQRQQQIALEAARGRREDATAQRQTGLDARADADAQRMAARRAAAGEVLRAAIGDSGDYRSFDGNVAYSTAVKLGDPSLVRDAIAAHRDIVGKVTEFDPKKGAQDELGNIIRQPAPEAPKPPTGPELDQKAEQLYIKKRLGLKMTPEEDAALGAYEDRKRVISDPAAAAAAERQTAAIAAAAAQQGRSQAFTESQAGRKELTDKVEQPYRQAQQSAQELRDFVSAAQAGNKEAASLQALQATMSMVRANGLNRLNAAEMKLPANAGSLWDRVQNEAGKLTAGQPINPDLQKDLVSLADLIERGAYNRYKSSHSDITTRYKLDEKPLPEPTGGTPSAAAPLSYADYLASRKKK